MNKEDLILQKLESMDADLKDVRSDLKDVRTEVKDVRTEVTDRMDKIESKLELVNADFAEMKINQAKQAGDLHTLEAKMDGKLQTLESKLDGLIQNMRERKFDTNERWKVGGIIVSCGVAVVSLILSILTRMGQ
ncbi:MAG: hypothetical protein OYL97_18720 [Candidatus Poribacteria bacterium]|nr:hypothetical protein [Candidatus Poribacteria bacterium]